MLTDCTTGPDARRFVFSHLSDLFILPQSLYFVKNFFQSFSTFLISGGTEFPNKKTSKGCPFIWRYRPDLNWRITVLQTGALPLGYGTIFGAGDEARTRYLHLGKVALYRMSYTRIMVPTVGIEFLQFRNDLELWCLRSESNQRHADFQSAALPTELQRHIHDA